MKRFLIIILLGASVLAALYMRYGDVVTENEKFYLRDEFDRMDEESWYIGEWGTLFPVPKKVFIKNGIINLEVNQEDRGPFLLSRPIPIEEGDVVTIKRRAKIHFANEHFTGGMSIFETADTTLVPAGRDKQWYKNIGHGLVMVEYVHNASQSSSRPGTNVFRVLPQNWDNSNNILMDPVFDDWFEEELIYDTRDGEITYTLNGQTKTIKGVAPKKSQLRVLMHNYGWFTGHTMKIDWFEVQVIHHLDKKE